MHKITCLLFLVLFHTSVHSTITPYYALINKAELSICDHDLITANDYYKQAFRLLPAPFSKDYHNAIICAMETNQTALARKYLKRLLSRGCTQEYLQLLFRSIDTVNPGKNYYLLKGLRNDTLKRNAAASFINNIIKQDQDLRRWSKTKYTGDINQQAIDTLRLADAAHILALSRYFKQHGIPGEDVLGNWQGHVIFAPGYDIVIQHAAQFCIGERTAIFKQLYEAVQRGQFHPAWFAQLASFSYETCNDSLWVYGRDTLLLPFSTVAGLTVYKEQLVTAYYPQAQEKRMNRARAMIGLESLDEYRKKAEFQYYGKRYIFISGAAFSRFDFADDDFIKDLLKYKPADKR